MNKVRNCRDAIARREFDRSEEAYLTFPSIPQGARRRGAAATAPARLPRAAWREILARCWVNSGRHDLGLLSAGVAFYAFLSFVPLLGALVMGYGLIADPALVAKHMRLIIGLVPEDAAQLIYDQLSDLVEGAEDKKGLGLAIALLVSIYGASRASGAMIAALNILYEQKDRRGFFRGLFVASALAASAVIVGVVGVAAASMLALAERLVGAGGPGTVAVQIATWLVAGALCSFAIAGMYRFAPHRADARWKWLTLGSIVATGLWLIATMGFGLYVARFGDYDATYGSLGAVVVLLMWFYVSAYAVLLGALVNAEAERQTARDTTTGPDQPMGQRGATMADTSAALHGAPR